MHWGSSWIVVVIEFPLFCVLLRGVGDISSSIRSMARASQEYADILHPPLHWQVYL